ncbi:hypothetical protein [Flavobacterium sp. TAB 87]|nr:hypothetical protein [Flavobacterium sp. TAB 87]
MISDLKIPPNHVAGFQYYVVENKDFMKIINLENKSAAEFLLVELAQ